MKPGLLRAKQSRHRVMPRSDRAELLAPCGSFEALTAALRCGADAVYLGGKRFSARHNAKNFDREELREAVKLCHRYGALAYQAINTCVLDSELEELAEEIAFACEIGIDGLIIQDEAALYIVKSACPDMPVHASTQLTLHTQAGIKWAERRGYQRAVVSRELPKEIIAQLCREGIEIEAFVHGALCMSVSGQCYLSAMIGSRSANRGLCAGACRLPFSAKAKVQDKYALSLKDMSIIDKACEISDIGVSSLKIEGRMKRPEYVAAATDALRRALDGEDYSVESLKAVFSRSGFTDGYYTSKLGRAMFGARTKEDVVSASGVLPQLRELYKKEPQKFPISLEFTACEGLSCVLKAKSGEYSVVVKGDIPEKAINRPTGEDIVKAQLSKLGGSLYYLDSLDIQLDGGLMLPLSSLNSLRRRAIEALDAERMENLTKTKSFSPENMFLARPKTLNLKYPELWASVQTVSQLSLTDIGEVERVIIPLSQAKAYSTAGLPKDKAVLSLPRFTFDEEKVITELKSAKASGFETVEATNPAHIVIAQELGLKAIGGFGLNITNSVSAYEYAQTGLEAITLSFELKAFQAGAIAAPVPTGAIVYGRLPLMLTVNCPINAEVGCKSCAHAVVDRTGAKFPILCHKGLGYYELLNSKTLWLSDKLRDFNLDFGVLFFTNETAEQVRDVLDDYRNGAKPEGEFTRGLYYRGIE